MQNPAQQDQKQGNTAVLLAAKYGTRPGLEVSHISIILATTTTTIITMTTTTTITMTATTIITMTNTTIKVLLSCPTVDLDIVDNLGRGLKEMVVTLFFTLYLEPAFWQSEPVDNDGSGMGASPNSCNVSFFQVRDSWRLSTGEKAEVELNLVLSFFCLK